LASIPEVSILYRYTLVLVSVSVSANSIDTLVHTSYRLRARSVLVCSMAGQWDDGFTPSRGIRCKIAGDAQARRR
jgi:hypothetical protein